MLSVSVIEKSESNRLHLAFEVYVEERKELIVEYESQLWKRTHFSADVLEKSSYEAEIYAQQNAIRFLLVDGIVWEQCSEPVYRVYSDGSVTITVDNSELDTNEWKRFNAFQYDEAFLTARRIARENGERKEMAFCPIRIYLPGMVKYPLNSEYASLYDAAGLRISTEEGYTAEQIAYLAHFLKADQFEIMRIKGKGSDALLLVGTGFLEKQKDPGYREHFRRQIIDILNNTAINPVPVECQLGDTVIWFGSWQVSATE